MCIPLAAAAVTASLVGTGLTAYSAYQQGQYTKDIANHNAQVDNLKTTEALNMGADAQAQQRARTAQILGAQRAAFGASGLQGDSGSAGDILADTARMGEQDAQTVRTNALKQAWGYQQDALSEQGQGEMAARAGSLNAMGTLLGGGAQAYGMWAKASGPSATTFVPARSRVR